LACQKVNEAQVSLVDIIQANTVDLGELDSASYDAVLLMGPMYHHE
jgi:hypothetical protein